MRQKQIFLSAFDDPRTRAWRVADEISERQFAAELERKAVHEGGHCVAARVLGIRLDRVEVRTVFGSDAGTVFAFIDRHPRSVEAAKETLIYLAAAAAAEKLRYGDVRYAADDLADARNILSHLPPTVPFDQILRLRDATEAGAAKLIAEHEGDLQKVVEALLARHRLSGDDVNALLGAPVLRTRSAEPELLRREMRAWAI